MSYSVVNVKVEGSAGIIQLNRPAKHNALSFDLLKELARAITELEQESAVRGIVLTGSDRAFSTGADLNEALTVDTAAKYLPYNRLWRDVTYRMEHSFKPIVAAISGYCVTGGLEGALAADIRYCTEDAQFAITSSKIGSVAGAGGTQRLPRLVGKSTAMELLFTSRFFDAAYAEKIGLVSKVVPNGGVLAAACELVDEFALRGPLSITWMKTAVNSGMNLDLDSGLDLEAALSSAAFSTKDKAEGMSAFLQKRTPVFTGE
jgi:enoyl-CoA hydratase/carnithine racemase